MSKKYLKSMNTSTDDFIDEITTLVNSYSTGLKTFTKGITKDIEKQINKEKLALLEKIAEGENLDVETLKEKYLKVPKKKEVQKMTDEVLDKVDINGESYYFENREGGNVYSQNGKVVGSYIDNKIVLNKND